jgi:hypothetical protein
VDVRPLLDACPVFPPPFQRAVSRVWCSHGALVLLCQYERDLRQRARDADVERRLRAGTGPPADEVRCVPGAWVQRGLGAQGVGGRMGRHRRAQLLPSFVVTPSMVTCVCICKMAPMRVVMWGSWLLPSRRGKPGLHGVGSCPPGEVRVWLIDGLLWVLPARERERSGLRYRRRPPPVSLLPPVQSFGCVQPSTAPLCAGK